MNLGSALGYDQRAAGADAPDVAEQYRIWFEDNPLPMWVFDPGTYSILDVNEAAIRHYCYPRQAFLSMTILDLRPSEDVPALLALMKAGYDSRIQRSVARHRTVDGRLLDVEVYAQRVVWNGRAAEMVQVHDISELKRANAELRNLSGRLLQLQDVQKRVLARELHDAIGQSLTLLLTRLAIVRNRARSVAPDVETAVEECVTLAGQTLDEIRTFSYLLHPPLLDEEGIVAALHDYVEGFAERSGIPTTLRIPADLGRLGQELEITLFRVVQEALGNIHRHSGSRTAAIRLERDSASLVLEIEDHGAGMPPDVLQRVRRGGATVGVGIAGMRERVAQLGGHLTIDSSRGGSTIRVKFPLPETE